MAPHLWCRNKRTPLEVSFLKNYVRSKKIPHSCLFRGDKKPYWKDRGRLFDKVESNHRSSSDDDLLFQSIYNYENSKQTW